MAYRLKTIRYLGNDRKILLQNENGPCPLLAAANALLLRGVISLPSVCIRNSCASLQDVTNMLAEKAMSYDYDKESDHAHHSASYVHDVLDILPKLQYGMDVNPKFTNGPTGMEFTPELTTFDLLNVKMVHGWLLDPQSEELFDIVGSKTYNELIETVIHGNEAATELHKLEESLKKLESCSDDMLIHTGVPADDDPTGKTTGEQRTVGQLRVEFRVRQEALSKKAHIGSLINHFLDHTSHQLTQYGLGCLYEQLNNNELCVFFRNNHFSTLTKHDGLLYLLVTDFGYANVPNVVWEKLDVIDGDTEYVDAGFSQFARQTELNAAHQNSDGGTTMDPDQLLAQRGQSEADYQLALQLSSMNDDNNTTSASSTATSPQPTVARLDDKEKSAMGAALEASLRDYNGNNDGIETTKTHSNDDLHTSQEDRDHLFAMQMQADMEQQDLRMAKQMQEREWAQQRQTAANTAATQAEKGSNCIIS